MFKIGDRVRKIKGVYLDGFRIGDVGTVSYVTSTGNFNVKENAFCPGNRSRFFPSCWILAEEKKEWLVIVQSQYKNGPSLSGQFLTETEARNWAEECAKLYLGNKYYPVKLDHFCTTVTETITTTTTKWSE